MECRWQVGCDMVWLWCNIIYGKFAVFVYYVCCMMRGKFTAVNLRCKFWHNVWCSRI